MGDTHKMVVNEMGKMVEGITVRLENNSVVDVGIVEADVTVEFVVDDGYSIKGHGKAHDPFLTGSFVRCSLFGSEIAAAAVVAWRQLTRYLFGSHFLKSFWGAVAAIGVARGDELICVVLVDCFALRFIVGPIRTTDQRPLIKIYTKPFQAFDEVLDGPFFCTCYVCILNTQDECTPCMACVQPVEDGGTIATDVLKASWARCEAQTGFASCCRGMLFLCTIIDLCHKPEFLLFVTTI